MNTPHSIRADAAYLSELARAGFAGAASSWRESKGSEISRSLKSTAWMPMTVGATAGVLAARYGSGRKRRSTAAFAGAAGTVAGFAAALAWASRGIALAAARNARRRIDASRDARWLELNPIDYA